MKFRYFIISLCLLAGCSYQDNSTQYRSPDDEMLVDYVNPLMGTDSKFSLSNGNTYPAIATPWAMNFWTPMTAPMGDGWTYKYTDNKIRGIKQTHQPSPWINDYAAFSIMPITGNLKYKEDERASWFSHKAEEVHPYFYKVYLADYDVELETTTTDRAVQFRITFPESTESYIIVDAFDKGSEVKIIPGERKIVGYCRNNSGGVPENFHNYFVLEFDKEFEIMHCWGDGDVLYKNALSQTGNHVGAIIGFKTHKDEQVHVKVASSFISPDQAMLNLKREIGADDFETTRQKSKDIWEKELGKIKVQDPNWDHLRTFYSCLYRVLLFPRKFHEINKDDEVIHYSPYNGRIEKGYMYTDNGFWDTFRAVFPFFNLMYPSLTREIMEGLANTYLESGWLPEWASPGHRSCMIGSNSAVNIADAYIKGNIDEDQVNVLWTALLKNADQEKDRPVQSVGREGLGFYDSLGYIPYDVGINENTARTLEYAYADFTLGRMAEKMGKEDLASRFYNQSENYKNVFDPETKWMRGRNVDGSFQSPFNPLKWGDAFTEGNSMHYTWSVFHDIQGLIDTMGGKEIFAKKLDEVFEMAPAFDDSYYGFTIHEIREMQIVNMGNYAHGNQPIQHMIYLYNYAGQGYKTQEKVREVMTKLYAPTPDGYCGDEDNGQTSAWYVFSALGFYPVTPGINEYVFGAPLFKHVDMTLENGEQFIIDAPKNSMTNKYIEQIKLNGEEHNRTVISFDNIRLGGHLQFYMTAKPKLKNKSTKDQLPFSMSLTKKGKQ